jgi:cytochrome c oxidase assembly protein subunit 20
MSIASFEFCQYKRLHERAQLKRTVEIVQEKRVDQARKSKEALDLRRRAEEEARAKSKAWYKFW